MAGLRICHIHRSRPKRATIYRVWAYLSTHPSASIDEIERGAHVPRAQVQRGMAYLEEIGVLKIEHNLKRAWRLKEPFSWVES